MKISFFILVGLISGYFGWQYWEDKRLNEMNPPKGIELSKPKQDPEWKDRQEPDDELGKHLSPDTKKTVLDNLAAMGYKKFWIHDYYALEDCPHGHLNFSVHFKGYQFVEDKKHWRQGYFCYPYNHEQVVYYKGKVKF